MAHALKIFSAKGDTTLAEWEVEDADSVEVACGMFEQATADGFAAVTPEGEGARPVDKFEPGLTTIYLLKPIAGG